MRVFNMQLMASYRHAVQALCALLGGACLVVWLNHSSINLYYQQKYHERNPFEALDQMPWWNYGDVLNHAFLQAKNAFLKGLEVNVASIAVIDEPDLTPPHDAPHRERDGGAEKHLPSSISPVDKAMPVGEERVSLKTSDFVFFVGDSLMQGITPHAMISLNKRFAIHSVDLSKRSTGLSYTGLFNWPKTVEETLVNQPHIRLMVVMLGPNDPWDIPVEKGKPYLRFKSEAWDEAYRKRIDALLESAKRHDVRVIWIGAPNMHEERLSAGMRHLNGLYESEVRRYQQIYIPPNPLLGYGTEEYDEYMKIDDEKQRARAADGIHFTPAAQRRFADKIISLIDAPLREVKKESEVVKKLVPKK